MFLTSYRRRLRAAALMRGIVTEKWRFGNESSSQFSRKRRIDSLERPEFTGPHVSRGTSMLTLAQKTLVQDSFATIAPIADDAAALFYRRLFELDPSLEGLFRAT